MAMVSTTHSQYLCPEFNVPSSGPTDVGKSPLAMLAKTCETIGLPDTPAAKGKTTLTASSTDKSKDAADSKKDVKSDDVSPRSKNSCSSAKEHGGSKSPRVDRPTSSTGSTDENGNKAGKKEEVEPSTSQTASSTSLTMPAFPTMLTSPGRCMPGLPTFPFHSLGFPPTAFPHHLTGFNSAYPSFPMTSPYNRCPDPLCKSCLLGNRPSCTAPGCTQCVGHSPDMASLWLYHQSMLGHSLPPPPSASSSLQSLMGASPAGKHMCNWVDSPGSICAKTFNSSEELMAHMRTHASADQGKASHANPLLPMSGLTGRSSPRSMYMNSLRFHPYSKFPLSTSVASSTPLTPHLPFPSPLSPTNYTAALSALYGQRLIGSLPHP